MALLLLMLIIKLRRSHWRKRFPMLTFPCVSMCCLLHSFVRERDGFEVETHYNEEGLYHLDPSSTKQPYKAAKLKDQSFQKRRRKEKWSGFDHLESASLLR